MADVTEMEESPVSGGDTEWYRCPAHYKSFYGIYLDTEQPKGTVVL